MSKSCGLRPEQKLCRAEVPRRMVLLECSNFLLKSQIATITQTFGGMKKIFKKAKIERHHLEYHRTFRPPDPDSKMCPFPTAPPPCSVLLRSNDIDRLCAEFKELWPLYNQIMAERTKRKIENIKLKRELRKLKEKYEPEDLISLV